MFGHLMNEYSIVFDQELNLFYKMHLQEKMIGYGRLKAKLNFKVV